MGLDIWFSEDVRNAIMAANEASASTAVAAAAIAGRCEHKLAGSVTVQCSVCGEQVRVVAQDNVAIAILQAHREGFKAGLATVAIAFGVSPAIVRADGPAALIESRAGGRDETSSHN